MVMVTEVEAPDSEALQIWLRERLARELKMRPVEIDLSLPPDAFPLDSVVVVEICAELGNWVQGRELQIEQWWKAESLQALCERFGVSRPRSVPHRRAYENAAPESAPDPLARLGVTATLGAPLARAEAGHALSLLFKGTASIAPGERCQFPAIAPSPDLLSVAYKQVDESTGEVRDTVYYGGSYMSHLRAWVTPSHHAADGHDVFVLNNGSQTVQVIVAVWTSALAEGNGIP